MDPNTGPTVDSTNNDTRILIAQLTVPYNHGDLQFQAGFQGRRNGGGDWVVIVDQSMNRKRDRVNLHQVDAKDDGPDCAQEEQQAAELGVSLVQATKVVEVPLSAVVFEVKPRR